MRIEKFAGLPAHPLFVHVPIVLLPLVAIGGVAMVASARIRQRLGSTVLGLASFAGISTQLAISSGEALEEHVDNSDALRHHVAIAESIRPLALVLFLALLAVVLIDRRANAVWPFHSTAPRPPSRVLSAVLGVAVVVVAVGTCGRLYQIGDSGAKATWQGTQLSSATPPAIEQTLGSSTPAGRR
jgi:uncharacterized membrane protein